MSQQSAEEVQRKQIELYWLVSATMQVDERTLWKPRLFVHSPIAGSKFSSKLNWNQLNRAVFALAVGADNAKGVI